jgi:hypothetical protein
MKQGRKLHEFAVDKSAKKRIATKRKKRVVKRSRRKAK